MKIFLTFCSLTYLSNHLYALEISEQELAKSFEENCRQSISSGISIGNNINVCNLVYINNFPKKSKEQLKELNQKIMQLKKEILHLKNKKNTTVINKTETTIIENKKEIRIIENKKRDLSKIETQLENLKKITLQNNQSINSVKKSLSKKYQIHFQKISVNYQMLHKEIQQSIDESNQLKKELSLLKNKVKKLERRVGEIEKQADENSNFIQRYVKHINAHFGGLSVIGATSIEDNPKNSLSAVAFEYEGYNPDNNSYIFGNVFYGKLKQELQYKTLARASETEERSNTFGGVELGYRQLFTSQKVSNWTPYGSSSVGYVSGDGDNLLAKVGMGMEYQYKSDKLLVEMGYAYMRVEQTDEITFNPLGESYTEIKEGISLPYVSLKYLWRF